MKREFRPNDIVYVDIGKFQIPLKNRRLARIATTEEEFNCPIFDRNKGIEIEYLDTRQTAWFIEKLLKHVPPLIALAMQS